jgi:hypothetical protein
MSDRPQASPAKPKLVRKPKPKIELVPKPVRPYTDEDVERWKKGEAVGGKPKDPG